MAVALLGRRSWRKFTHQLDLEFAARSRAALQYRRTKNMLIIGLRTSARFQQRSNAWSLYTVRRRQI